jgi:hypothetical protein
MSNLAFDQEALKRVDTLEARAKAGQVRVLEEEITPLMAEVLIARMGLNRDQSSAKKNQYLSDMKAGRWESTSVLCIGDDGRLKDGQHRLESLIKYGYPLKFQVMTGIPESAVKTIDIGRTRSIDAVAKLSGIGFSRRQLSLVRTLVRHVPTIKKNPSSLSHQDIFDIAREIGDALSFSCPSQQGAGQNMKVAAVDAAIAFAFYNENREQLVRFRNILQCPMAELPATLRGIEKPGAALLFRQWFEGNSKGRAGQSADRERFLKCIAAINNFCSGVEISKLYAARVPARYRLEKLENLSSLRSSQPQAERYKTAAQAATDVWGKSLKETYSFLVDKLSVEPFITKESVKRALRGMDPSVEPQLIYIGKSERTLDSSIAKAFIQREINERVLFYRGCDAEGDDIYVFSEMSAA